MFTFCDCRSELTMLRCFRVVDHTTFLTLAPALACRGFFLARPKAPSNWGLIPKLCFFRSTKFSRGAGALISKLCDMINPFFNRQPLGSSQDIGYQIRPSTGAPRSFAVSSIFEFQHIPLPKTVIRQRERHVRFMRWPCENSEVRSACRNSRFDFGNFENQRRLPTTVGRRQ